MFIWDSNKNKLNIEKHKLSFEDAQYVFNDSSFKSFVDTKRDYGEKRFIGFAEMEGMLFSVSYTIRNEMIRIISFRKARQRELNKYINEG